MFKVTIYLGNIVIHCDGQAIESIEINEKHLPRMGKLIFIDEWQFRFIQTSGTEKGVSKDNSNSDTLFNFYYLKSNCFVLEHGFECSVYTQL